MLNRYYNPVQTVEGPGCAGELAALLREMALEEGRVLLLVWNEDVLKLPTFMELADAGFMVCSLVFRASNPTVEQLFETYQATRDFAPEVVVAVGGGSILDVGKSLCCLYGTDLPHADSLRRLIEESPMAIRPPGGSACPPPRERAARSPAGPRSGTRSGMPSARWSAGKTTLLPPWWTRNWRRGCRLLWQYLPPWTRRPTRWRAIGRREPTLCPGDWRWKPSARLWGTWTACWQEPWRPTRPWPVAACWRGWLSAIPRPRPATPSPIPLTMHCGIPHGAAVSMLLGPVFQLNAQALARPEPLLDALGVSSPEELAEKVCGILRRSGQPATLKEWGAQREELPRLARLGMTKGRADNNPVPIEPATILSILEQIYDSSCKLTRKGA